MIIESLIAALMPAGVDAVKSIAGGLGRKFGGLSVDDEVKLDNSQVERLKALALLDNPGGTPSQWVVNLRASFRYIGAGVSILAGVGLLFVNPALSSVSETLISVPFSFIFGERMLMNLKGK
jgi:hypothetical protein